MTDQCSRYSSATVLGRLSILEDVAPIPRKAIPHKSSTGAYIQAIVVDGCANSADPLSQCFITAVRAVGFFEHAGQDYSPDGVFP